MSPSSNNPSIIIDVGSYSSWFYTVIGWSTVYSSMMGTGDVGKISHIPYWVYNDGPDPGARGALVGFLEMWRFIMDDDGIPTGEIDPNGFVRSQVIFKSLDASGSFTMYNFAVDVNGVNVIKSINIETFDTREHDLDYPLGIWNNTSVELTFHPNYIGVC